MSENVWTKMINRINMSGSRHPETEPLVLFLQDLFTEKQADLIANFPLGLHTAEALAETLDRDEDELKNMLEEMSVNELIFEAKAENGRPAYSVLPFEPGLMEMQLLKGSLNEKTLRFVQRHKEMQGVEDNILEEMLKKPEVVKERFSRPGGRIIPIEEHVAEDKEIADWERVSNIVENETSYAVGECGCKLFQQVAGNPCKTNAPSKCCIWFGIMADYLVERDIATRYTKEEVYQLLKDCEDAGLVHFAANRLAKNNVVLCNCCDCCCVYLRKHKRLREAGVQLTANTNFVATVDEDACVGCGECVEYCQLDGLSMSGDVVSVNAGNCLGCGACISKCPTESLSLVRISRIKPPPMDEKIAISGFY